MRHIYLDYNTTTPLAPVVQEAMVPFLAEYYGTPSGAAWINRASAEAIEDARSRVASLINAHREEIIFTSGATESVNLAIKGTVLWRKSVPAHIIATTIDHASVLETLQFLESWGCDVSYAPVSGQGVVTAAAIEGMLRPETALVCMPHVGFETGAIQPIKAIAEICHRNEVLLHVNAAGSLGRLSVHAKDLDADLISMSAHQMYAPKGTGALYVRQGVALSPLIHGPGHESGLRGGTQHVAGIVGFGRAASLVRDTLDSIVARHEALIARLRAGLLNTLGQSVDVFSDKVPRLSNCLCVSLANVDAIDLLMRAAEVCALPVGRSPSLISMGITPVKSLGAIRLSVGWYTSDEEIDRASALLSNAWDSLRS